DVWSSMNLKGLCSRLMQKHGASVCLLKMQRARLSDMKLTWIGNFIAPWTNWSVCNGSVRARRCLRHLTLIWGTGTSIFAKQSQSYWSSTFRPQPARALGSWKEGSAALKGRGKDAVAAVMSGLAM